MKKNNVIAGILAVSAIGAGVAGGTHISRTQDANSVQVKNNVLLANKTSNTIPLDQTVIRTQTYLGIYPNPNWLTNNKQVLVSALNFNQNDMKININQTNFEDYLTGYENNNTFFTQYVLYNNNLKEKAEFNQLQNNKVTNDSLNGATFNYGDIIGISSIHTVLIGTKDTKGSLAVNSENTGTNSYYEITQKGLVPLNGIYGGKIFNNGILAKNTWVTLNGNKYYAGNDGEMYTGTHVMGNKEFIFDNSGILESSKTLPTISFNSWPDSPYYHGNTLQLIFANGTINANGLYKWIGTDNSNSFLDLTLYKNDGNVIKDYNISGTDFGSNEISTINGQTYSNGDILLVNASFPEGKTAEGAGNKITTENSANDSSDVNINGKTAFTITSNGLVPLTGYHKLDGQVYDFVNGIPTSTAIPELSGVNNIKIAYGSSFNPMNGVKLTDAADPTAKIEVSGTVDTNKAGNYTLTYKVTDSFGRNVEATRVVTVGAKPVVKPALLKSEVKSTYWTGTGKNQSLVINGNLNSEKTLSWKVDKKIVIKNAEGTIVKTINTVPVNWYSSNKENYSGYQAVIPSADLSGLESGTTYQIDVQYNNQTETLNSDAVLPANSIYYLGQNNSGMTISKIAEVKGGQSNLETGYIDNNGFVVNANININGQTISSAISKEIVITNSKGEVIYKTNTIPVNWYSSNKDNYSGLQGVIPSSVLTQLEGSQGYTVNVKTEINGKIYLIPIKTNDLSVKTSNAAMYSNDGVLAIGKLINKNATAALQIKYQDGINTVENYKLNIPDVLAGSKVQLQLTNSDNEITTSNPILVNWYSNNKDNFNGVQLQVNTKKLTSYKKADLLVTVGNITYTINLNL